MIECSATEVIQDDEVDPALLSDIVNSQNVRVIECGCGLRAETPLCDQDSEHAWRQHLQCDGSVQAFVAGFSDSTDTALADFLDDGVVGETLAGHKRLIIVSRMIVGTPHLPRP